MLNPPTSHTDRVRKGCKIAQVRTLATGPLKHRGLQSPCATCLPNDSREGPVFRPTQGTRRPSRGLHRVCSRCRDHRATFCPVCRASSRACKIPLLGCRFAQPGIRRVGYAAPLRRRSRLSPSCKRWLTHPMAPLPHDDIYQLVREPIDMAALARHVRAAEDGAIVTFDGFVRNQSHNRPTLYLDYEAYESMALAKMREIGVQLHEKYRIHRVAIVHRLGRLEIGETSVFIAVSAPHRAAAFDACRFAIDTLKRTVPIWKKEYFEDGAVWADGELPPAPAATPRAKPAS